jgi:hypothetical protein
MVVWGVVSSEIEQVIEVFRTRREAERMLAEVGRDERNPSRGAGSLRDTQCRAGLSRDLGSGGD